MRINLQTFMEGSRQLVELLEFLDCTILTDKETEDEIMDVNGLSEYMKVTLNWIYKHSHVLPNIQIGEKGTLRFRKSEIDFYLKKHSTPGIPD